MFDSLFGGYALKTLLFFIVVFGLLALALWLMKRFGAERLRNGTVRGRQPRLAVLESAAVDGRRRLVLIRRDNVEHLLMIGGPTDLVVETNVLRGAVATREAAAPRPLPSGDTLPRAVPLGEGNTWPLQPEPAHRVEPLPRAEPPPRLPRSPTPMAEEPAAWPPEPELPTPPAPPRERRPRVDPLAGLAEELSRTPAPSEPQRVEPPPRSAPRREPRVRPQMPVPQPPAPASGAKFSSPPDQNLAEMAQRLEAALRRPTGKIETPRTPQPEPQPQPESVEHVEEATPAAPPEPTSAPIEQAKPTAGESRSGRPENKPSQQKSLYDSLEQEMANLLGRSTK